MLKWTTGAAAWTLRDGGWWIWLLSAGGGTAVGWRWDSPHAWTGAAGAMAGAMAGLLLVKATAAALRSLHGGEATERSPSAARRWTVGASSTGLPLGLSFSMGRRINPKEAVERTKHERDDPVHSRHRVTNHPNGATTHSYDFTEGTGKQYPHLMDTLRRNKGRAWTFAGPHGAIDPRNIDIHIGTKQQAVEATGDDDLEDAHKYMDQFENL